MWNVKPFVDKICLLINSTDKIGQYHYKSITSTRDTTSKQVIFCVCLSTVCDKYQYFVTVSLGGNK